MPKQLNGSDDSSSQSQSASLLKASSSPDWETDDSSLLPSSPAPPDGVADDDGDEDPVLVTVDQVLQMLSEGTMEEKGLLPYSSNYSFLVLVGEDDQQLPAVYKPRRGENPLWDFPTGTLCQRETAAFQISAALDWDLVPPTVLREGTRGIGSVQFYIDCDPDMHYFTLREDARIAPALRRLALFDYVINNADRKSGHCLYGYDERLWAIDHGICFHHEYKLRTVIWEFSGDPIEEALLADLDRLHGQLAEAQGSLSQALQALLNRRERQALCTRVETLLQSACYPAPRPHQRNHPWPPI